MTLLCLSRYSSHNYPSNSSTVFGKVGYYEHRPGGSTLKNVLIIPLANMLILATVMCMPLNDNNLEL